MYRLQRLLASSCLLLVKLQFLRQHTTLSSRCFDDAAVCVVRICFQRARSAIPGLGKCGRVLQADKDSDSIIHGVKYNI